MSDSERVTGPHSGLGPLTLVLILCVLSTWFIWHMHQTHYVNPLETVTGKAPAHGAPASHGSADVVESGH